MRQTPNPVATDSHTDFVRDTPLDKWGRVEISARHALNGWEDHQQYKRLAGLTRDPVWTVDKLGDVMVQLFYEAAEGQANLWNRALDPRALIIIALQVLILWRMW